VDWRLLGTTFVAIFVAELGDKTQLATFSLASETRSRLSVFLGAALALTLTSAIGVLFGGAVSQVVPAVWMRRAAGALFIVLGLLCWLR